MEIASAFVTIRPETSSFSSELVAAVGGESVDVPVVAATDEAQAEIEGLDGGEVDVEVNADTEAAQEQIGGLGDALAGLVGGGGAGGASGALDAFTGAALGAGGAASIVATGGLAALAGGLGASVSAAADAEVAQAKLQAILDATGASAYTQMGDLQALATEIQNYSGLSDEAVQGAEAMLLTFSNVNSETAIMGGVLEDATKAAADIARFMGTDAVQAAGMLGRALDDPIAGTAALRRAKISFTDAEMAAIEAMAEEGNMLGAQQELLRVVEDQVGGVARAYGDTMAGQVDVARQKLDNAAESIGSTVIPIIADLAQVVGESAEGWQYLIDSSNDFFESQKANVDDGPDPAHDPFGHQFIARYIDDLTGATDHTKAFGDELTGKLPGALGAAAGGFASAADAARAYASDLTFLDDRTRAYLEGVYRVPEAERGLREALAGVQEVLSDPAATADDLAVSLEGVATATGTLGTATGNMAGAVETAKFGLLGLTNQGAAAEGQVDGLINTLDAMPGQRETQVGVPGATQGRSQVDNLTAALMGLPPSKHVSVAVDIYRGGFDALLRDLTRLDAADTYRAAVQVSAHESMTRDVPAGGGGVSTIRVVNQLDGRVLEERIFEVSRRGAIAEGYEQ